MPILVISDIMCRVGPIVHQRCPTAAPDNGVLPRTGEPDDKGMRQVDIPALASLPGSNFSGAEEDTLPVVEQEPCPQKNVYNLLRDAAPSPRQQQLDFSQLFEVSAVNDAGSFAAAEFVLLARGCWRQLHRHSHYSLDLFEIVAVLNARITKVAACIGEVGDPAPVAAFVEDGGEVDMDSVRKTLSEQSVFSTRVLAVATGSITGEVPVLPPFSDPVFERLVGDKDVGRDALENLCFDYAQVSP